KSTPEASLPPAEEARPRAEEVPSETGPSEPTAVPYAVTEFARGLFVPWSLVFTSPERLLVTERSGAIRIIENGKLSEKPLASFNEVSHQGEEGLMGLAKDPAYGDNKKIYVCLAYGKNGGLVDKVISFVDKGDTID